MRIMWSLLVVAACGKVNVDEAPKGADAAVMTDARSASPDAMADAPPPDAPSACRPTHVADAQLPVWFGHGGFTLGSDPAGSGGPAWVTNSSNIPNTTAFIVPTLPGDRLTGLAIDTYGNGGLGSINVVYQPDAVSQFVILAQANDGGHGAQWAKVTFPSFQPATLSGTGLVYVQFVLTKVGYYLGKVTPEIDRPCH